MSSRYHEINWVLFRNVVFKANIRPEEGRLYLCPWKAAPKSMTVHEMRKIKMPSFELGDLPLNVVFSFGEKMIKPTTGVALAVVREPQTCKINYHKPSLTRSEMDLPLLGLQPLIYTETPSTHCGLVRDYQGSKKITWRHLRSDITKFPPDETKYYSIQNGSEFSSNESKVSYMAKHGTVFHVFPDNPEWRSIEAVELLSNLELNYKEYLAEFLKGPLDALLENEDWDMVITDSLAISICVLKKFPDKSVPPFYFGNQDMTLMPRTSEFEYAILPRLHASGELTGPLFSVLGLDYCTGDWTDPVLEQIKTIVNGKRVLVLNLSNRFYTRKIASVIKDAGGHALPVTLIRTTNNRLS